LQDAILVNIARGHLLDYDAVKSALETGRLAGLGMDVAWSEPFDPSDPVARHPNVILTPHVAGVSDKSYRTMAEVGCCYFFFLSNFFISPRYFGITYGQQFVAANTSRPLLGEPLTLNKTRSKPER
jgi:hypothetical protein